MWKYFGLFCFFILSCNNANSDKITSFSFYYWKQDFTLSNVEKEMLTEQKVSTVFVKYFDVIKENENVKPTSVIHFTHKPKAEIVPVIFIVNQVLQSVSEEEVKQLANRMYEKIISVNTKYNINTSQLQLDCDWTPSTQKNFFLLCRLIKQKGVFLYSTVRLHQYKYFEKTGVPPVDKGVLMCYSTSSPLKNQVENSILDPKLLEEYLEINEKYPLELAMALPIYSWLIVTNHLGKKKLIEGVTEADLNRKEIEKTNQNTYICNQSLFINGIYISKGFKLKLEKIQKKQVEIAVEIINKNYPKNYQLIYYHLDKAYQKHTL